MLDDISKCRLLKKLLQGPVRDIIQCYRDTSADYKNLIEALKKLFDKLGTVRSFIPRQERESPAALRAFYTQTEAVLRQLRDVGEDTEHYSFVDIVELKLGPKLSAHVIPLKRTCKLDEWTMTKLLSLIENFVLDAEEIAINRDLTTPQTAAKERDGKDHYAKRVNAIQTSALPEEGEVASSDYFDDENSHST